LIGEDADVALEQVQDLRLFGGGDRRAGRAARLVALRFGALGPLADSREDLLAAVAELALVEAAESREMLHILGAHMREIHEDGVVGDPTAGKIEMTDAG